MATTKPKTAPTWSIFSNSLSPANPYAKVPFDQGNIQAQGWAVALLKKLGIANPSTAQTRFIYDWELAEKSGGLYNPLNQGPVPGHPELSGGSQFGGGAANYNSPAAGLQGALDFLNMPNYRAIKQDILSGDIVKARAALVASPWAANHYGGNPADLPTTALPSESGYVPPSILNQIGSTVEALPGAASNAFGQAGGAIGNFGGSVLGGTLQGLFTGLLKSPIALIIIIVVVILLLKKR